jgi:hypothetical protein
VKARMDIKIFIAQSFSNHFALMRHFACWAPLIGGAIFVLFIKMENSNMGMSNTAFIVFSLPLAYLLGVIPAALSGFVLGFFDPSSLTNTIALAALISGVVMLLCLLVVSKVDHTIDVFDFGFFMFTLLGAMAGAGAAFLKYRNAF